MQGCCLLYFHVTFIHLSWQGKASLFWLNLPAKPNIMEHTELGLCCSVGLHNYLTFFFSVLYCSICETYLKKDADKTG